MLINRYLLMVSYGFMQQNKPLFKKNLGFSIPKDKFFKQIAILHLEVESRRYQDYLRYLYVTAPDIIIHE